MAESGAGRIDTPPVTTQASPGSGFGIAANTANNSIYVYGTTTYNGSPTNYTSEFDCLTNSWTLYASPLGGTTPSTVGISLCAGEPKVP